MTLEDFTAAAVGDKVRAFVGGVSHVARIFHKNDTLQIFALVRLTKTGAVLFACLPEWCYGLADSPRTRIDDLRIGQQSGMVGPVVPG